MISFLLNNKPVHINNFDNNCTVLEWLRESQKLNGTKEGCGSGDCGACTVVLAEVDSTDSENLNYKAINSCITFLSALDGKQLITVENLEHQQQLHPVQQAMVDEHGSQCGFCTPGFVMSLFALYKNRESKSRESKSRESKNREPQNRESENNASLQSKPLNRDAINVALSGNLCRCTGYRPIIDATLSSCSAPKADQFTQLEAHTISTLKSLGKNSGYKGLHIPASRKEMARLLATYPDARLVAGSTDLALEVTQMQKHLANMVSTARMPELNILEIKDDALHIGAAVTYSTMESTLLAHFPELTELLQRLGSLPIRNQGTMGGNIANASPIGDTPPALLALEATITLDDGISTRQIPLSEFFLGYKKTALQPGEWLREIVIPLPAENSFRRAYKISKRIEDDISAVCAVFNLQLSDNKVIRLKTGFGGVAAIPAACCTLEDELVGKTWDLQTVKVGKAILTDAFSPLTDVRASADYRNTMLQNLWQRFWLESCQQTEQTFRIHNHA